MESNSSEEKRSLLAIRHTKPISAKYHEENECEKFRIQSGTHSLLGQIRASQPLL